MYDGFYPILSSRAMLIPKSAISDALIILGYAKVYHMREVGKNGHPQPWADLINAKYDHPEHPLGRADFEPLLGDWDVRNPQCTVRHADAEACQALADFPASIFAEELIDAYPDAKVILLQRDEDAWFSSMMRTFGSEKPDEEERKKSPMQALRDAYQKHCWKNDVSTHGRDYLRNYQKTVRSKAPSERLLEFPTDGSWELLCPFLQKVIPTVSYPNRDDHREWKKI